MSLNSVLSSIENGVYIKGQSGYADFYPDFGWFGGLEVIDVEQMYKLNLDGADVLEFTGNDVNPEDRPISLTDAWNWIGYLPNQALDINIALEKKYYASKL